MFELLDIKWGEPEFGTPSGTINWSADLGGLTTTAGVTQGDLEAALQLAFNAWESIAAIDFEQVASGGHVSVTYDAMGYDPLGSNIAGVASWGPNVVGSLNTVTRGIIEFNSDMTWSDNGVGGFNFYAVALHEIGHIIGLDHVDDTSEIMNPVVYANRLGDGDIDGAQYIYGTGSGSVSGGDDGGGGGGGGGGGAIALLLGLLALIAGLFTGGAGGAVAMAAGRVDGGDDGLGDGNALDDLPHLPVDDVDADLWVSHAVYVPPLVLADGLSIPMVEHDCQPKACGCFGHCGHADVDPEDLFDWA